jgi:hypothetical protein
MKQTYYFFLIFVCAMTIFLATAYAQDSLWKVQRSDDGTVLATVAIDHAIATGTLISLMNVGFAPKGGCQPELGIAMLKGNGYGTPVGRLSPPHTEPISFAVDKTPITTPAPFVVKYNNGLEAVFSANQSIMQAIANGTMATAQLVPGTPRVEFPISGARTAFDEALHECQLDR